MPKHIVRLRTDSELVGLGEAGRGLPIGQVQEGASLLLGKDPELVALQDIYGVGSDDVLQVGTGPAYDAFEMALCDWWERCGYSGPRTARRSRAGPGA